MRLQAYAGASTALAAGVVIYAFNQRANFYSACVYLAQSNLCLMILTNLILFLIASFTFGLQRFFYGPLRPIEIEQLYEKAWFAVTETCLAMTIFREEVGAWFLVMFVALLTGKVWGWIGEGRVEVMEQQPPANPRLFHIRLSFSLALSLIYDLWLMAYTINTVIQQARPNMMVMFLFEFAVLTTSSSSTALRYAISLIEVGIVKKQTQERLAVRRSEVRAERAEILRQREVAASGDDPSLSSDATPPLPSEDDIDEMDIEVPGWEAKGQWVLTLDLVTDFVKLAIYSTFFFILMAFYGLPIHIMRDLFLTARSFVKRLTAFMKYRNATKDMNKRYPDATVEEIQREDTCIICREEMRAWSVTNPVEAAAAANAAPPAPIPGAPPTVVNERSRPKKLPCGHVLHLGCLKSWLERQQVCPTCRRPVVQPARPAPGQAQRPAPGAPAPARGQPQQAGGAPAPGPAAPPPPANGGMAAINIGPLRLQFGRGQVPNLAQGLNGAQAGPNAPPPGARVYGLELGFPRNNQPAPAPAAAGNSRQAQLQQIHQQIMTDIMNLQLNSAELQTVVLLEAEFARLRQAQNSGGLHAAPNAAGTTTATGTHTNATATAGAPPPHPQWQPTQNQPQQPQPPTQPTLFRHGARVGMSAIPSGSGDLPPGVTIPEGWSLLPLQNLENLGVPPQANGTGHPPQVAPNVTVLPLPRGVAQDPIILTDAADVLPNLDDLFSPPRTASNTEVPGLEDADIGVLPIPAPDGLGTPLDGPVPRADGPVNSSTTATTHTPHTQNPISTSPASTPYQPRASLPPQVLLSDLLRHPLDGLAPSPSDSNNTTPASPPRAILASETSLASIPPRLSPRSFAHATRAEILAETMAESGLSREDLETVERGMRESRDRHRERQGSIPGADVVPVQPVQDSIPLQNPGLQTYTEEEVASPPEPGPSQQTTSSQDTTIDPASTSSSSSSSSDGSSSARDKGKAKAKPVSLEDVPDPDA